MSAKNDFTTLLFPSISELTDFAIEASLYFHEIDEENLAVHAALSDYQIQLAFHCFGAKRESKVLAAVLEPGAPLAF